MARVTLTALRKNPKLLEASRDSLAGALLVASQLGLEPDGKMGALVPYKGEIQFIPMYQGLIKLAYNSEQVADISAYNVYSNEKWKLQPYTNPPYIHDMLPPSRRGDYVGSYCVFKIKGSDSCHVEWMWAEEVNKIKAKAMEKKSNSPWMTDEDEMRRKTVVRRALKYAPMSSEALQAVDLADRQEFEPIDVTPINTQSTADKARAVLGAKEEVHAEST